jgi:hypothetical protein
LVLYATIHQPRFDKDSLVFLKYYEEGRLDYYHPLYLPAMTVVARGLAWLGFDWMEAVRLYSCLCGAAAVLFVHRLCWLVSGAAGYALFGAAMFALAPTVIYFATLAELNMGGIALLSAALLGTLRSARVEGSWRQVIGDGVWGPGLFALACAHHTANALMGVGLVLAHALSQPRSQWRRTALFAAIAAAACLSPRALTKSSEFGSDLISGIFANPRWFAIGEYVADQLLFFGWAFVLLGLWGVVAAPRRGLAVLALLLTALPGVVVFGIWDRADTGAYYMPLYPFLLLHGAGGWALLRGSRGSLAIGALLLQALFSGAFLVHHNWVDHERQWREGLVATIAASPQPQRFGGVFLFGFQRALDLERFAPGIVYQEMTYWRDLEEKDPDSVREHLRKDIQPAAERGTRFLLDQETIRETGAVRPPGLGWIAQGPQPAQVLHGTLILRWLREHFEFTRVERPGFQAFWLDWKP